jgi:hypothetical protein
VAVANELVIAHPRGQASITLSVLLFGGPLLYVLSQTFYLWAVIGRRSLPRLAGIAALAVRLPVELLPSDPIGRSPWSGSPPDRPVIPPAITRQGTNALDGPAH